MNNIKWVSLRELESEFSIGESTIVRWQKLGLIKRKDINLLNYKRDYPGQGWCGQVKWLYDRKHFIEVFSELRLMDEKIKKNAVKKYNRKLSAIECEIEKAIR